MTESAADIRQRVDNMIDTLRCQRDAAETRAETYYYAYTKALHCAGAAEAKLADAVLAVRHCEDSNWRLTKRVLPAEAKLAAIQKRIDYDDVDDLADAIRLILDGEQ